MYHPPYHRRILQWTFIFVFLITAPALVFYTAGYRWNFNKAKVERNGTLIIDSKPTNARIFLNGNDSGEISPVTIQNTTPGHYDIRLEKTGYYPWHKSLDVQPERVTFANDIWLWREATPTLATDLTASSLAAAPNEKILAYASAHPVTGAIGIWDLSTGQQQTYQLKTADTSKITLRWSSDSRSLLVETTASSSVATSWLLNVRSNAEPLKLPSGQYAWTGSVLNGLSNDATISIRTSDGAVTRTPLPASVSDRYADMVLRHVTDTESLVFFQGNDPKRGLVLPPGNWHIEAVQQTHLILRDGENWLSLDPDAATPTIHRVSGDHLRAFAKNKITTYLLIHGSEIWLWNPATDPELLLRFSQPIVNALWHTSGSNIFVATPTSVFVLNLDHRDGYLNTPLANFDSIQDIEIVKKQLFITATKNGQSGIWTLDVE